MHHPINSSTTERDILEHVPGTRLPTSPGSTWTTFTHTRAIIDRQGTKFNLARDAAGQEYIDLPSPSHHTTAKTRLILPIDRRNLQDALRGQQPLIHFIQKADWVFLTHEFQDKGRPQTVIMARPSELLANRYAVPFTTPPPDFRIRTDYRVMETWSHLVRKTKADYSTDPAEQYQDILRELRAGFHNRPLENGLDHPAEGTLIQAIEILGPDTVLPWITEYLAEPSYQFQADLITCLSRIVPPGHTDWPASVVALGLGSADLSVRDAAASAAENWLNPQVVQILQDHREPEPFLAKTIREILRQQDV